MTGYKCSICQDCGFIHPIRNGRPDYSATEPCVCVKKEADEKRKQNLLAYCELPIEGKRMTFNTFKINPDNREAYDAARSFAAGTNTAWSLTLMGNTGYGKTHLAIAIVNERLRQEKPAKYVYVPLMLDEIRDGFKDDTYRARYNTFLTAPLLVLDDLGTESPTPWAKEHLDAIYNDRLMNNLPTITTTNLKFDEIPFRIANRMKRNEGLVLVLCGTKYKAVAK